MPSPASRPLSPTSAEHPANLARAIAAQAAARPGLRLGTTDDQLTLQEALGFAARRARDLLEGGLRPGQQVAMVDSTSTDYLLTWLACVLAGTPVALVNPTYPADLIERMLAPLGPERILRPDVIAQARAGGKAALDGLPGLHADPFGVVSYMHTSGTTGLPKFCIQTHDYFRRMAAAMAAALDLTPDDRVLAPLPLFHINPMGYGIVTALLTGADALTVAKFSASRFWPSVVSEQVTVLTLHAPPVEILKRATTGADAAGHRVRTMFYADAEFLRRFAIPAAVSGYGSTEAGGVSHLRRWSATEDIPADASRHRCHGGDSAWYLWVRHPAIAGGSVHHVHAVSSRTTSPPTPAPMPAWPWLRPAPRPAAPLREVLPAAAALDGPVDTTAAVSPEAFGEALRLAAEDGVAALIAVVVQSASADEHGNYATTGRPAAP
jgi:hypothetical protein